MNLPSFFPNEVTMPRQPVRHFEGELPTRIVVPRERGDGLIDSAKGALRPIEIVPDFEDVDDLILPDEQGKGYRVRVKRFEGAVKTEDVVAYFCELSYDGSAAAFIAWILADRPRGCFASIPSAAERLWRRPNSRRPLVPSPTRAPNGRECIELLVPCYRSNGHDSELYLEPVNGLWSVNWSFVGFQEDVRFHKET
ncbi:MAG: hypothetical protein V1745_04440 [Patescibacteria group bacterium]